MSGSRLIELIQQQAKAQQNFGIELATVISPPPKLIIRVDNMPVNLERDDLVITERAYQNIKKGDRVAVQVLPGGQQYLVIDKVVTVNG